MVEVLGNLEHALDVLERETLLLADGERLRRAHCILDLEARVSYDAP